MSRREFRTPVCREIVARATDAAGTIRCERCKLALKRSRSGPGGYEIDHIIPEALRPEAGKFDPATGKVIPLKAYEGQLLGRDCCHRPDEGGKTRQDVAQIAKAKAQADKDVGLRDEPKHRVANRKSDKPKATSMPTKALPRRQLFRSAR